MAQFNTNSLFKLVLVGGAGYLGYMAYKKKALPIPAILLPATTSTTQKPVKQPVPLSDFPLKKGSRGQYVRNLQAHLGVKVDGIFGAVTEAALVQRYGKRQIMTLAELNGMIATGTVVPTRAGTKPSLPVTTPTPKPASKPTPPAQAAIPAVPVTPVTDFQKKLVENMWKVFGAIWSKKGGSPLYTEQFYGDWKTITPVLASMNDSNLKGFMNAYGRSFKNLQFAREAKRTGTLLGDLQRIKKDRLNAAYMVQVERVKRLS